MKFNLNTLFISILVGFGFSLGVANFLVIFVIVRDYGLALLP